MGVCDFTLFNQPLLYYRVPIVPFSLYTNHRANQSSYPNIAQPDMVVRLICMKWSKYLSSISIDHRLTNFYIGRQYRSNLITGAAGDRQ